jgi:hypothetical protein
MFRLLPDLTKEWIRERVSDEEIFSYYLNINVVLNKKFCSPLRKDRYPTCNFFITRQGVLWLKDHSGHFAGNCFDLVMFMYNVEFYDALMLIAKDFRLIDKNIDKIYQPKTFIKRVQEKAKIEIVRRNWNNYDKEFWKPFGLTSSDLHSFRVCPVQFIWLNGNLIYTYNANDPAYGYVFTKEDIKIYFPYRKEARFLCNTNILQGIDKLPERGKLLCVTKSYKDVMVMHKLEIPSVAPQSETQGLTKEQFESLSKRFDDIISLYDFDLTGVRTANSMRKEFGIEPFFLTNGRFKSENFGVKDISDYVKFYGYLSAIEEYKNLII